MRVDALHRKVVTDAAALHRVVDDIFPASIPTRYDGKSVSIKQFIQRLNRVSEPLGHFCETKADKEVSPGLIFNTGLWLGSNELPENESHADVRILWHHHPSTKCVTFTQPEWSRRRYYFWSMTMHELIHRYQDTYRTPTIDARVYRTRSTSRDIKEEQEYYGNYDEIEAHSHDAALELFRWWPHLNYRDAVRESLTYTGRLVQTTYSIYESVFTWKSDSPHPAYTQFKRKVKAWYDVIQQQPDVYHILNMPSLVN